ncbi:hypothetical protein ACX83E_09340, partial [Burkholderia pseudomallei]
MRSDLRVRSTARHTVQRVTQPDTRAGSPAPRKARLSRCVFPRYRAPFERARVTRTRRIDGRTRRRRSPVPAGSVPHAQ